MKTAFYPWIVLQLTLYSLAAQSPEPLLLNKARSPVPSDYNSISFTLSTAQVNVLHEAKGKKPILKVSSIIVNEEVRTVKHIHVRGKTSTYYRRKSLNIKTKERSHFYIEGDTFAISKFYAISMAMDRNYVRNKIAYEILASSGLRVPTNCYARLRINGASEGLYLIFDPPDDYAIKKCHSPFVIRRGFDEAIDKMSVQKNSDHEEEKEFRRKFRSLYSSATLNMKGQELYEALSGILDLNSYFRWLAFNHLFQNGDYADEVYFMWNPEIVKFEIIPWDFDDILKSQPHEGTEERSKSYADRLMFSLEDDLDKKIAGDDYVYGKYLHTYREFLNSLTGDRLRNVLTAVFDKVCPYYQDSATISQSAYDQYGETDINKLEADLNNIYEYITLRSTEVAEKIAGQLSKQ